jgi:hypothetical protein
MSVTSSSIISAIGLAGWNVATPTTSPSQSSSTSSQNGTSQPSGGLSTNAKAGIGVSAAIGGIGIVALIVALFLLRRRSKRVPPYDYNAVDYNIVPPVQAEQKPIHELGIQRRPVELPEQR